MCYIKAYLLITFMICKITNPFAVEQSYAADNCYSKLSEVLKCFVQHHDDAFKYEFLEEERDSTTGVRKLSYLLSSQKWPIGNYTDMPTTTWQHRLTIYIPDKVNYNKALLYVDGGYNVNNEGEKEFCPSKDSLEFVTIAQNNHAIVVDLQNVPNQFLFFDGLPKKEDQILAYTYKMVMQNPLQNAYLAGHLPMAKSIIKAMDATQEIMSDFDITGFILAGGSKRGWAVWLAALEDERVEAIIPTVIDILNTQKSIIHICEFYKEGCPLALRDYIKEGIVEHIDSKEFADLMKIEDPFNYLGDDYADKYKERLSIPKYILNASGDDFFVPDSSKWYFKNLPGSDNYIRYLPNASHYLNGHPISAAANNWGDVNAAIDSYFYFILNKTQLPKVTWEFNEGSIDIVSSHIPIAVKLWSCNNGEEKDFRYINSYTKYWLINLYVGIKKWILNFFEIDICDNCYEEKIVPFECEDTTECKISAALSYDLGGWSANFVELYYNIDGRDFIITSEVNII